MHGLLISAAGVAWRQVVYQYDMSLGMRACCDNAGSFWGVISNRLTMNALAKISGCDAWALSGVSIDSRVMLSAADVASRTSRSADCPALSPSHADGGQVLYSISELTRVEGFTATKSEGHAHMPFTVARLVTGRGTGRAREVDVNNERASHATKRHPNLGRAGIMMSSSAKH